MTVWLDAQLSPKLATWITANVAGITAVAVRDLGLRDADDATIFGAARQADVVVMTKDRDFADMVIRLGPPPRVLWVRTGNTSNAAMRAVLGRLLPTARALFDQGNALIEIR